MDPKRDPEELEPKHLGRIEKLTDARVLEIGSGNGRLTKRYGDFVRSVVGMDTEADALSEAKVGISSRAHWTFNTVQGLAEVLPFKAESFDAAIFAWSL